MYQSPASLAAAAICGALGTGALVIFVSHGLLRPLLEARGVRPWSVRDTIGSTPLVWLGSAAAGAGMTILVVTLDTTGSESSLETNVTAWRVGAAVLVLGGLIVMRLGLLAIRKFT